MANALMNKIFQGEVSAVHNYGAFVKIPGLGRTQGLVHKSQISSSRVDDASEVLELNEKVWFKVISVSDDGKVGLSMKVVDQGNGSDLDPNNVQISLDVQARKERVGRGENAPITLDAILKTTCSKCGIKGHLSRSCFKTPDSKTYELLPEPEPEKKIFGTVEDRLKRIAGMQDVPTSLDTDATNSKKKKKKKEKKNRREHSSSHKRHSKEEHTKRRSRQRSRSSGSESSKVDDSSDESTLKRKKKEKSRKRRNSSSSDSSSHKKRHKKGRKK